MNRIKEVRVSRGLTQRELAHRAGMEQTAVARLEAGEDYARSRAAGRPKLVTLQRLATAIGCRWWELLSQEDLDGLRDELRADLEAATAKAVGSGIPADEVRGIADSAIRGAV